MRSSVLQVVPWHLIGIVRFVLSKITRVVKKDGRKDLGEMQPMYSMWWLNVQMAKVYWPKHQHGRNANQLSKDNNPLRWLYFQKYEVYSKLYLAWLSV